MERSVAEQRRRVVVLLAILALVWGSAHYLRDRAKKHSHPIDIEQQKLIHSRDEYGNTPLHLAVAYGRIEGVVELLGQGALIEAKNRQGFTPLLVAVEKDNLEAAKILLDHGADINAADEVGFTPLHAAVRREDMEMLHYLLDRGADKALKAMDGFTPRQRAAMEGKEKAYELLTQEGAP